MSSWAPSDCDSRTCSVVASPSGLRRSVAGVSSRSVRSRPRTRGSAGYRRLIAQKYDGSKTRKAGRPKAAAEIEQLILRMARDNAGWGYTRIRRALRNLGHKIGRNTIKRILFENGIDPASLRIMSWETFLKAHWGAIAATDFFSVEVLTRVGLNPVLRAGCGASLNGARAARSLGGRLACVRRHAVDRVPDARSPIPHGARSRPPAAAIGPCRAAPTNVDQLPPSYLGGKRSARAPLGANLPARLRSRCRLLRRRFLSSE